MSGQGPKYGFSWTTITTGNPVNATDFNEMKNNLNTLFTYMGDTPSWDTDFPLQGGATPDPVLASPNKHIDNIRDNADDLHSNWCGTHWTAHHPGFHSGYDSGYKGTNHGSHCTTYDSPEYATYHPGHHGSDLFDKSTHHSTERNNHDTGYNLTNENSFHGLYDATYHSNDNGTYDGTEHASYNSVHHPGYLPSSYTVVT